MVDAPSLTTTRAGLHYPAHTQKPGWFDNYMKVLAEDVEKLVIPKYSSATTRDAAIPSPVEGDMCWLQDSNVLQVYETTWRQIYPATVSAAVPTVISSGTAAPSGGSDGDIYLRYV